LVPINDHPDITGVERTRRGLQQHLAAIVTLAQLNVPSVDRDHLDTGIDQGTPYLWHKHRLISSEITYIASLCGSSPG
jgi:hypothetical protein